MSEIPFLCFSHGPFEPGLFDKCEEVFIWFERPLTLSERKRVVANCPPPIGGTWTWADQFAYFGSSGDTFEFEIATAYGPDSFAEALDEEDFSVLDDLWEVLCDAAEPFAEAVDAWLHEVHAIAPITFFSGVWAANDPDDPWASHSRRNAARAVDAMRRYAEENPWVRDETTAGSRQVAPAPEKGKVRAPRVPAWSVETCTREGVAQIYGWIYHAVSEMAFVHAAPSDKRAAVLERYERDGLSRAFGRLSTEEHTLQSNASAVEDWLTTTDDAVAALRSLDPYTQLAFLASYRGEASRAIEAGGEERWVAELLANVPDGREGVAPTLALMIANGEAWDAPGYDSDARRKLKGRDVRLRRAARILGVLMNRPDAPEAAFVDAAAYLTEVGDDEPALAAAQAGCVRFPASLPLLEHVAESAKALGRADVAAEAKATAKQLRGAPHPDTILQETYDLFRRGQVAAARVVIEKYLDEGGAMTRDILVNYTAVLRHAMPADPSDALDRLEALVRAHATWHADPILLENVVACMNENGRADESIVLVEDGLAVGLRWRPELLTNYTFSAYHAKSDEVRERAVARANELRTTRRKLLDRYPATYLNLACIAARDGRIDDAFADIAALLELDPNAVTDVLNDSALAPLHHDPRWAAL